METVLGPVVSEILKLGVSGAIIIYLAWRNIELQGRYDALQDKRVEEAKQNVAALASATETQRRVAEAAQQQSVAIATYVERVGYVLDMLRDTRRGP